MVGRRRSVYTCARRARQSTTDIATVQAFIDKIYLLLVMTVKPGFGATEISSAKDLPRYSRLRHGGWKMLYPSA